MSHSWKKDNNIYFDVQLVPLIIFPTIVKDPKWIILTIPLFDLEGQHKNLDSNHEAWTHRNHNNVLHVASNIQQMIL
jgi:hypothetical protein